MERDGRLPRAAYEVDRMSFMVALGRGLHEAVN